MKQLGSYIFAVFILMMITSCDPDRIYETNQDLNEENWKPEDTIAFTVDIEDAKSSYNLYYNIRYSADYPYYNLFTKYILSDSTGNILRTPKLPEDMFLFDVKTGKPLGSGVGSVYDHQVSFLKDFIFPYEGKYTVKVVQYMRNKPLNGISSIGLRVEKAKEM